MVTGECFCGEVIYQVNGELFDARSCHCSRCRKAFNSQASAYALVHSHEFEWLRGEASLSRYTGETGYSLCFCNRCGSTLGGEFQGQMHGVTLGCLNGDPPVKLQRHIYTSSKASWETIPNDIPHYKQASPING